MHVFVFPLVQIRVSSDFLANVAISIYINHTKSSPSFMKKKKFRIEPGTSCFHLTNITTRALVILMKCDCFNVMHSTQILGHISFNLTVPKLFLTIMQLNLITITPPFLAGLINFYEK